jgi:hypothetical protein
MAEIRPARATDALRLAMTCAELAADVDIVLARHVLSAVAERRRLAS